MLTLDSICREIDEMLLQVGRQRREISRLKYAGLNTTSAEALVAKIEAKIEQLRGRRNELRKAVPRSTKGRVGHRKL